MTPAQYEAAAKRIRDAGELAHGKLCIPPEDGPPTRENCSYCAIGALLDGPDGFEPVVLLGWHRQADEAMAKAYREDQWATHSYAAYLDLEALAFLAERYGLDQQAIDRIVTINDEADQRDEDTGLTRTDAVLDELDRITRGL